MKLLTPVQNRDLKAQEETLALIRTQELNKEAEKARKLMANAEADFNNALAKHKQAWANEEEAHELRMKEMKEEITILEERRKQALIPVSIEENRVKSLEKEVLSRETSVKQREEDVEILAELLENRLDEVGSKEQDLVSRETAVTLREDGVEKQADIISQSSITLTEMMDSFTAYKQEEEAVIKKQKEALLMRERSIESKEQSLKRTDQALTELAQQLEDQRQTLKRAMDRIKK